jgi:hypothetical protein
MRRIDPENLSVRQIHYLLLEKRRAVRQSRLVLFHRTGRVIPVLGEIIDAGENNTCRSIQNTRPVKLPRTWLDGILLLRRSWQLLAFFPYLVQGCRHWAVSIRRSCQFAAAHSRQRPSSRLLCCPMDRTSTIPGCPAEQPKSRNTFRPLWQSFSMYQRLCLPRAGHRFKFQLFVWMRRLCREMAGTNSGVWVSKWVHPIRARGNIVLSVTTMCMERFRYLDQLSRRSSHLFTSRRQYTCNHRNSDGGTYSRGGDVPDIRAV